MVKNTSISLQVNWYVCVTATTLKYRSSLSILPPPNVLMPLLSKIIHHSDC